MYNLNVLFYLKKTKTNKVGEAPIYLRITINGQRTEMSIKRVVYPNIWDTKSQRVKGRGEKARLINNYIDSVENKLNRIYNIALQEEQRISADYLKNILTGNDKKNKMLISVFEEYNKLMEQQKGKKYVSKTVDRYFHALGHIKKFLRIEYNLKEIELVKLDLKFMRKFDIYLQTECNYHSNTVTKYLKILKTVIHSAVSFGYLDKNPFQGYSTTYKEGNRRYLTAEEIRTIETQAINNERLERVRDIFIFICYSGISYSDLQLLTNQNITKGIDGRNWLTYQRVKTKVRASVPLLSPAQSILDKYKNDSVCVANSKVLPVISNQKFNDYLKEVAAICKITKPVSAHIGRHSFATTITLSNGVPMESVQKMLAHSKISTTMLYAKVVDTKISKDMDLLEQKMKAG